MNEETVTIPVLDLGDLGKAIDDAVKDADDESDIAAAIEELKPDATTTEEREPDAETEAAADVEPVVEANDDKSVPDADAEEAYRTRFEAEYAERSRADIGKLRSSLDRQITNLSKAKKSADLDLEEAAAYAEYLEKQLAEYDPDEVARIQKRRTSVREQAKRDLRTAEIEQENRRNFRDREFRRLYPDLDPNEPELLSAFEDGNYKLEAALIRERLNRIAIAPAPQPVAKAPEPKPEAKAPAPRAADGKFVSPKAEETRKREVARGHEPLATKKPTAESRMPVNTLSGARVAMREAMTRMGVPS